MKELRESQPAVRAAAAPVSRGASAPSTPAVRAARQNHNTIASTASMFFKYDVSPPASPFTYASAANSPDAAQFSVLNQSAYFAAQEQQEQLEREAAEHEFRYQPPFYPYLYELVYHGLPGVIEPKFRVRDVKPPTVSPPRLKHEYRELIHTAM